MQKIEMSKVCYTYQQTLYFLPDMFPHVILKNDKESWLLK